jgi:hypothetical protein
MSGILPNARPKSADYGPDVRDDRPVENPELETSANDFNNLKADGAYAARMTALRRSPSATWLSRAPARASSPSIGAPRA